MESNNPKYPDPSKVPILRTRTPAMQVPTPPLEGPRILREGNFWNGGNPWEELNGLELDLGRQTTPKNGWTFNNRKGHHYSGQFITTSAEVTPNGGLVRESPQNGLKLGHWLRGRHVFRCHCWELFLQGFCIFQRGGKLSRVNCYNGSFCWDGQTMTQVHSVKKLG